jgi:hypothetical protein
MTDRRTFLRGGLAASVVGGAFGPSGYAAFAGGQPRLSLHKVLVDGGLVESVAFGEVAESNGSPIHVFARGDISDVWYDELDLLWRERRAPIAGLTRHGPLFVLERFAWDRGMRVVFHGEHVAESTTVVAHRLRGCPEAVSSTAELVAAGADWAEALPLGLMLTDRRPAPVGALAFTSPGRLSCSEPLYSWAIA